MSVTFQRIPTPSSAGPHGAPNFTTPSTGLAGRSRFQSPLAGKLAPEAHLLSIRVPVDEVGYLTAGGQIEIAYDADDQDIDVVGELPDRLNERWQEWASRNWPTAVVEWLADYEQDIREEITELPPRQPDDDVNVLEELNDVLRAIQVAQVAYQHPEWQAAARIGKDFAGTPDELTKALDGVFA